MNTTTIKWIKQRALIVLPLSVVVPLTGAQTPHHSEYRILQGDTLGSLAEKIEYVGGSHSSRRKLIQDMNPQIFIDGNPNFLVVGSIMRLSNDGVSNSNKSATTFTHQISKGDTLGTLAEKIESFGGTHNERRKLIREGNPHIFVNNNADALIVGEIVKLGATSQAVPIDVPNTPINEHLEETNPNNKPASNGLSDGTTHLHSDEHNDNRSPDYHHPTTMAPNARMVQHDNNVFKSDPDYGDDIYNAEAQKAIYGGKQAVFTPRPLLELGRPQYQNGPLSRTFSIIGDRNQIAPALAVYGDLRTGIAANDNGGVENDLLAARLNLDIDLKLSGTERFHAFIRPLDKNNQFSRISLNNDNDDDEFIFDGNLETLFFEGDLGAIVGGLSNKPSTFDLPFAIGLMPLLFQNGVWMEDAFTGLAISVPARNSRRFDISNFDITFFAGFDKVSNEGMLDEFGRIADENVNVYGLASFWELLRGYAEVNYAYIDGKDELDPFDHHNVSFAFSKRINNIASTSVRVIHTFGQDLDRFNKTAGGTMLIWENSLITSKPSTFIPYMNLFAGFDRPRSVARDNGGLLKTIGINFETDGLTGYPLLDDSGQDVWGGAIGIQNLFSLDQQLVLELAGVKLMDDSTPLGKAKDDQLAFGIRYQRPLGRAWLFRADAIKGWFKNDKNIDGLRFEIRRKF